MASTSYELVGSLTTISAAGTAGATKLETLSGLSGGLVILFSLSLAAVLRCTGFAEVFRQVVVRTSLRLSSAFSSVAGNFGRLVVCFLLIGHVDLLRLSMLLMNSGQAIVDDLPNNKGCVRDLKTPDQVARRSVIDNVTSLVKMQFFSFIKDEQFLRIHLFVV